MALHRASELMIWAPLPGSLSLYPTVWLWDLVYSFHPGNGPVLLTWPMGRECEAIWCGERRGVGKGGSHRTGESSGRPACLIHHSATKFLRLFSMSPAHSAVMQLWLTRIQDALVTSQSLLDFSNERMSCGRHSCSLELLDMLLFGEPLEWCWNIRGTKFFFLHVLYTSSSSQLQVYSV